MHVLTQDLDRAAAEHLLQVRDRDPQHLIGDQLLDLAQTRGDRLVDELLLDRVLGVEVQVHGRTSHPLGDQALDLLGDGRGDHYRVQRLAVANLGHRLGLGVDADRLDRLQQL